MESETEQPQWKPIGRVLRRVLGVLVEKAKTTPDVYPMTINAITTASNQKSNRHPKMELSHDDVDEALEELRELGAVAEIQGDGRKPKYRHKLYEWMGVDKVEIAVMAELLLRGEQTLGDLRARASRMEKIDGQSELKPIVQQLIDRHLMLPLTPAGRGQIVTHNLYLAEELAKLERNLTSNHENQSEPESAPAPTVHVAPSPQSDSLMQELAQLREEIKSLTKRVSDLEGP